MRKQLVLNGVHINIQHRRLTKSLKLTESTACFLPREENYLGKWQHVPHV
jgi:hypothetical protein